MSERERERALNRDVDVGEPDAVASPADDPSIVTEGERAGAAPHGAQDPVDYPGGTGIVSAEVPAGGTTGIPSGGGNLTGIAGSGAPIPSIMGGLAGTGTADVVAQGSVGAGLTDEENEDTAGEP